MNRALRIWFAALRSASACVGYGWMVSPMVPRPAPARIATLTPVIRLPASAATIVAPRIRSVPFRTWTRAKPASSPSSTARSTSASGCVKVSTSTPFFRASASYMPTCAISGSV